MDFLGILEENWQAFASAPIAFLGILVLGAAAGYWLAKGHFVGVSEANKALAEAARERNANLEDQLRRVQSQETESQREIGFLVGRLTDHGEAINDIQDQLQALPKIIVSDRPPGPDDVAPGGSLWVTTKDRKGNDEDRRSGKQLRDRDPARDC